MFSTADTIVAVATPPGRGGIGVVRLSGPLAREVAESLVDGPPLAPRHATFVTVKNPVDQAIVTWFPAPRSYTGDEVVEISAHGSPVVLEGILRSAVQAGARLAAPGEFTLRAFLNGRIDLTQAEAVADLVDAVTPAQARAAFDQLQGTLTRRIEEIDTTLFDLIARLEASVDFPDEGYHFIAADSLAGELDRIAAQLSVLLRDAARGRLVREGLQIAIVGAPNVGKSSLFNRLVGASRAIVADAPGTTRDLVSETVDFDGLRVTLVDTAGLRETSDPVEIEGVERSRQAARVADLVLLVADGSEDEEWDRTALPAEARGRTVLVANKSDVPGPRAEIACEVRVSARTGEGLDRLRAAIHKALDVDLLNDRPAITDIRHAALVERALEAVMRGRAAAQAEGRSRSEEFVLADLQDARDALEEVTGKRTPDDLLEHIFARFCIGK